MSSPKISTSEIDKKIAVRIRAARQNMQLDADWVADRLGITPQAYQALEAGELYIRATTLARLSIVLQQRVSWFYADCPGQDVFAKRLT
ncbi:MAG: helix-turn-helix transcriptional regulator [Pseudomonadota bacterium]